MRFEDPIYLYLLALIPLFAVVHYVLNYVQKRRLQRFGEMEMVRKLVNSPLGSIRFMREIKFWLLMLAWSALC